MADGELFAGVELGGTKTVVLLARGHEIVAQTQIPTSSARATLREAHRQLAEWYEKEGFAALGIASFGPIGVNPEAVDHGRMLDTPKMGWPGADVARTLTQGINVPWLIDTDVNAAALAEWRWGAAQGESGVCYITLGTGVGGGIVLDGKTLHGALHPEVGHIKGRRADGDTFRGVCPFHDDCVEGLISGPALRARFGQAGELVSDDNPTWTFVAHDLTQLIVSIALTVSPGKVLIGGSIGLGRSALLSRVRAQVLDELAGYLPHVTTSSIDGFVDLAGLGKDAGPLGAIALSHAALAAASARQGLAA